MTTDVLISTNRNMADALENKGLITADDGVIVLKKGVVQYWIIADQVKLVGKDGNKVLTEDKP